MYCGWVVIETVCISQYCFCFGFDTQHFSFPWSEIEILPEKSFLFFRWRSLILGRESRVPLMLKSRVASALLEKRDTQ